MSDTWVNWGDFIGANKDQLQAYDARVAASQAEQQAAMNSALASLGSAYAADNAAVGDYYGALTKSLQQPQQVGQMHPTAPAGLGGGSGGQYADAFGNIQGTPSPGAAELARSSATGRAADASYSALMASQNAGQAAFKGYGQSTAAPGWSNALYSARTQYVDPWGQLNERLDPLKTQHDSANQAAQATYEDAWKYANQHPNTRAAAPSPGDRQNRPFGGGQ